MAASASCEYSFRSCLADQSSIPQTSLTYTACSCQYVSTSCMEQNTSGDGLSFRCARLSSPSASSSQSPPSPFAAPASVHRRQGGYFFGMAYARSIPKQGQLPGRVGYCVNDTDLTAVLESKHADTEGDAVTRFAPRELLDELVCSCLLQFQNPNILDTSVEIPSQEVRLSSGFRTTSGASSARLSTAF